MSNPPQPAGTDTGSDVTLPRLIFGSSNLGNLMVATSDESKRAVVRSWLEATPGKTAIDSAGKYGAGLALEVIGRELAAASVAPAEVLISNKLAWRRAPLVGDEPTFEPGVWKDLKHDAVQDISPEGIRRCWEEGDQLLGDYRTDLLSVHDPDEYLAAATDDDDRKRRLDDVLGAYQTLAEIRDTEGLQGIGVGCKDWQIVKELDRHVDFDWVMIANSLTIMSHPAELLSFLDSLHQKGVRVINSAVLHGGFLTGGDYCDYRPIDPSKPEDSAKLNWRDRFRSHCQQHGVSVFQAAVAFGVAHRSISSIALSSTRAERTPSMVDAVNGKLPAEFWNDLKNDGLIRDAPSILASLC